MYYVNLNSSTYGPYSEQQVRQMVASGQVTASTLVFAQGGQPQWIPASKLPNLFKAPTLTGMPVPNPVAASLPITQGNMESTVWQGRPSAWTLLDRFLLPVSAGVVVAGFGVVAWLQLPRSLTRVAAEVAVLVALLFLLWLSWKWVQIMTVKWTLTTERLCWERGVFSRTIQNLELYRVKDIILRKPFLMRLLRRGYLDLITSDKTERREHQSLGAIANPGDLHIVLRKHVERQRQMKGVREVDYWHA